MNDWTEFKKSFTQEQEDAIWQWMIDHSKINKFGFFIINLSVKNVNDMWKRIFARYNGDFKRYEILEKQEKQQSVNLLITQKRMKHIADVSFSIDNGKNYYRKFLLWIHRKTRKLLFNPDNI